MKKTNIKMTLQEAMDSTLQISDLSRISKFYRDWDGKQKSQIPTTNIRLQRYLNQGKDQQITITEYDQLRKYDTDNFYRMAKDGFSFVYQHILFKVEFNRQHNGSVIAYVYGKSTDLYNYTVTYRFIKEDIINLNKQAINQNVTHAWKKFYKTVLEKDI